MPRATRAQVLERQNEMQALDFFEFMLRSLKDPRRPQGRRYPLRSVVLTALMASVCGCDDAEAMELWGKANSEWLSLFLELPHGAPTQDVFLSIFAALEPKVLRVVLRSWAALVARQLQQSGQGSRTRKRRHIALDGKTSRRCFDAATGTPALHTVSAYLAEAGLVLAQAKCGEKSNEISAIREVLRALDLRGATISIDAIGCQSDVAKDIVEWGGDYLLAVKGNQKLLKADIIRTFEAEGRPELGTNVPMALAPVERCTRLSDGHGRHERRTVRLCRDLRFIGRQERWPKLSGLLEVTRERHVLSTAKASKETCYYIFSDPMLSVTDAARLTREHWTVENELHWVLDMAFRDDAARYRARTTAENMATVRAFAFNLIGQDADRNVGVANARRRAGWDRDYLLRLLRADGR